MVVSVKVRFSSGMLIVSSSKYFIQEPGWYTQHHQCQVVQEESEIIYQGVHELFLIVFVLVTNKYYNVYFTLIWVEHFYKNYFVTI